MIWEEMTVSRFKQWLYNKFLPAWCKDDLLEANARLTVAVEAQRQNIDRLNAYIDGLETAIRYQRRVTVRNEVRRE